MLSAINHTLGNAQYPTLQQDDAGAQRRKRSTEDTPIQLNSVDVGGTPEPARKRRAWSGLDTLGRGNVL